MARVAWVGLENKGQRVGKILVQVRGATVIVSGFRKVVALDHELVRGASGKQTPNLGPHDHAEVVTRYGAMAVNAKCTETPATWSWSCLGERYPHSGPGPGLRQGWQGWPWHERRGLGRRGGWWQAS